ncbi:hypothetical protein P7L93_24340, partial [Vibrio parahaemolyticus]|nr:hypothetical protein [Vibrio parahaemolyticus]
HPFHSEMSAVAMLLRWKNFVFLTLLMWDLKVRSESRITPRLETLDLKELYVRNLKQIVVKSS